MNSSGWAKRLLKKSRTPTLLAAHHLAGFVDGHGPSRSTKRTSMRPAGAEPPGIRQPPTRSREPFILAEAQETAASQLADQVSKAQLRGLVLAVDFDRREITIRDRHGRRHTFTVAGNAKVARGATMPGASVVVDFDLRDNVADRIERSRF